MNGQVVKIAMQFVYNNFTPVQITFNGVEWTFDFMKMSDAEKLYRYLKDISPSDETTLNPTGYYARVI